MEEDEKRAFIVISIFIIGMICIVGLLIYLSLPVPTPHVVPINNTVEPFFNRTVVEVR